MDSFLIFIVVLGALIFFHELGHFLVARVLGVGVEKFSLGFGPRLLGKTIGRTDYRVSLVPLGGYVKMIGDEPDAPLAPEDQPLSFTHKHPAKRSLIVAAGPVFNMLLAFLIFSVVLFFTGQESIRPVIRSVLNDSPAKQAGLQVGDVIKDIDGRSISSWHAIDAAITDSEGRQLSFTVQRQGALLELQLKPQRMVAKDLFGDEFTYYTTGASGLAELGAVIDGVQENMPAGKAGLRKGDQIIAINGKSIERWETMQEMVSSSAGKPLTFRIRRGDKTFEVQIKPDEVQEKNLLGNKQSVYRIGIMRSGIPIPKQDRMTIHFGPLQSLGEGLSRTWFIAEISVKFFAKLVQGKVPMESIGGPIRIAQMARKEAQQGIVQLLYFMAAVSMQLAILNLLPIPVLDGGHLLFFAIEAIQRRPVSMRMRETAQQIGIFLLILLMIFVFYNDITLTWFQ